MLNLKFVTNLDFDFIESEAWVSPDDRTHFCQHNILLGSLLNCMPHVPMCLECLHVPMPTCLACLHVNLPCMLTCQHVLHAYMLKCQCALHAYVLTCQHILCAYVLKCQRALRAYVLKCQRALRVNVPCIRCLCAVTSNNSFQWHVLLRFLVLFLCLCSVK